MAIKSSASETTGKPNKPFPKLMVVTEENNKGMVILFSKFGKGVVVYECGSYSIGYYSETWDMSVMNDYNEPVTLVNE